MSSTTYSERDCARLVRELTNRLLNYWSERKIIRTEIATNMAEFSLELEWPTQMNSVEIFKFVPVALDAKTPEVRDPLEEINLGTIEDPRPTIISGLLDYPLKSELIALLHEFKDCFAWHYHEIPGYNQITLAEEDCHKTTFRCPGHVGAFEYVVMPFGLKNAGATYQRAINVISHGYSLEVYIDDVVIKSHTKPDHMADLRKAFQ
ncbi:hypothetical protein L3X38_042338 [Prunus dulcis]|uniref:Reverse transcriptase domain-containing protein n=1 Tax=Prunus dulcis TaxID=3755 RepID=A0AAD4YLG8_PRUDU|nr:hypothetical protein L3X38_042338 [Prunus dulcis]